LHARLLRGFGELSLRLLVILDHALCDLLDLRILGFLLSELRHLHLGLVVDRGADQEELIWIAGGAERLCEIRFGGGDALACAISPVAVPLERAEPKPLVLELEFISDELPVRDEPPVPAD